MGLVENGCFFDVLDSVRMSAVINNIKLIKWFADNVINCTFIKIIMSRNTLTSSSAAFLYFWYIIASTKNDSNRMDNFDWIKKW